VGSEIPDAVRDEEEEEEEEEDEERKITYLGRTIWPHFLSNSQ
jgi:hypothetical protein